MNEVVCVDELEENKALINKDNTNVAIANDNTASTESNCFNFSNMDKYTLYRLVFITIGVIFLIVNNIYGLVMTSNKIDCILDKAFVATESINKYLGSHQSVLNALLIFSSFCVDLNLIVMLLHWVFFGKSWRIFLTLNFFYGLRGLCQMKYPEGYLWQYPGFPSLSVSYLKTNDFFFSGHVGFPIIFGIEFQRLEMPWMSYFCVLTLFVESFTMLVTRGHYIIDIITGILVAHYLSIICEWFAPTIDKHIPGFRGLQEDNDKQIDTERKEKEDGQDSKEATKDDLENANK